MKWIRVAALACVAVASSSASAAFSAVLGPALAEVEWLSDADVIGYEELEAAAETPPVLFEPGPRPRDAYLGRRYDLDRQRESLATRRLAGESVVDEARQVLTDHLPDLMEAWVGTKYSYSGTSQVPGEGRIACGYYVSTVLEHAGFALDRVEVARQASEQIIRTVVPDADIRRFHRKRRKHVVAAVEAQGPGVYLVGLDTHVGFLLNNGDEPVRFCHSTRRKRRGVVCEEAVSSPSLKSRYTVLGQLDNPVALDHWLDGATFATARRDVRQGPAFGTLPAAGPEGGPRRGPSGVSVAALF
ncbi:MAG: hypothetical protein AAF602_27005 [Myxococcota bacterium]